MAKLIGKPDTPWLISAIIASLMLCASIFLPLWRMELLAPQYPKGLAIWAYGNRFASDTTGYYEGFDTLHEINGLNHYIGMKAIQEVWAMDIFVPGLLLTAAGLLLVSFVTWHKRWFQGLMVAAVWFIPIFFVAVLQYNLWDYGHTMKEDAALSMDPFTPRIIGSTNVWNFHTQNSFQIGFYLMVLAAITISFLPPAIRWFQSRRQRAATAGQKTQSESADGSAGRTPVHGRTA